LQFQSFSKATSKSGAPQLAATATDTSYDGSKPDESQRKQHMLNKVKASYGRQADNPLFSNSLPVLLNSTVRAGFSTPNQQRDEFRHLGDVRSTAIGETQEAA
ncbi:hypothetical protein ANCCAN_20517, partial [Ancylostoma caninum]